MNKLDVAALEKVVAHSSCWQGVIDPPAAASAAPEVSGKGNRGAKGVLKWLAFVLSCLVFFCLVLSCLVLALLVLSSLPCLQSPPPLTPSAAASAAPEVSAKGTRGAKGA